MSHVSKDGNAPVATVRPMSKLPMPSASKLRKPMAKRPLVLDESLEYVEAPQAKKVRPNAIVAPSTGKGARLPAPSHTVRPSTTRPPTARNNISTAASTKAVRPEQRITATTSTRQTKPSVTTRNPPSVRTRAGMPTRTTASTAKPAAASATAASNGPTSRAKRPAWDLKGRLADIENQLQSRTLANSHLSDQVAVKCGDNLALQTENGRMKAAAAETADQLAAGRETIRQLERTVRDSEEELAVSTRRFRSELEDLSHAKSQLDRQLTEVRGDLAASQASCAGLKTSIAQLTSAQAGVTAELTATKSTLLQSLATGRQLEEEIARLNAVITARDETVSKQEARLRDNETSRRKLHNEIQELKGNIRVFCRVRPLLGDECQNGGHIDHINFPGGEDKNIELLDESTREGCVGTRASSGKKFDFSFDRIFGPSSTQEQVFDEISQLVQSALDGYNVCVFAYGQTGSGKTYTMEGSSEHDHDTAGMIPRAVRQIFLSVEQLKAKGWQYNMEASFLEIYNETVRDLLATAGNAGKKCEIKMTDAKGSDVEVTNSTTVGVTSEGQTHGLLARASDNRAVAATNCNEHSSRSHSVFRLRLSGSNELTGETSQGTLNLVDLAGSERLSQSGSTGDRLRETKNINRSLSTLGNVILALANKDAHVPYRNSKLTHLLQNSLGGNSKTLMFVNVSPREENLQESLCSLRFATKVNQCNIGTAQKKVK